jgi:hypothetical protein
MNRFAHKIKSSGPFAVAFLALVIAMSGSALAASLITSKQIKDGTIQVKDISKTARAQLAVPGPQGPAGPAGAAGATGAQGDKGETGARGEQGVPGEAVAYANVRQDGTIEPGQSKGITNAMIKRTTEGVFCFENLGFTPHSAMVSPDGSFGQLDTVVSATVLVSGTLSDCDADAVVRVRTIDLNGSQTLNATYAPELADRRFTIWFE